MHNRPVRAPCSSGWRNGLLFSKAHHQRQPRPDMSWLIAQFDSGRRGPRWPSCSAQQPWRILKKRRQRTGQPSSWAFAEFPVLAQTARIAQAHGHAVNTHQTPSRTWPAGRMIVPADPGRLRPRAEIMEESARRRTPLRASAHAPKSTRPMTVLRRVFAPRAQPPRSIRQPAGAAPCVA